MYTELRTYKIRIGSAINGMKDCKIFRGFGFIKRRLKIFYLSKFFFEMREYVQDLSGFIPVYIIAQVRGDLNSK